MLIAISTSGKSPNVIAALSHGSLVVPKAGDTLVLPGRNRRNQDSVRSTGILPPVPDIVMATSVADLTTRGYVDFPP